MNSVLQTSAKVSAVIVTRGDVDLGPVLSSIDADEIVIRRGHGGVWERWEAAREARHEIVYTQDDDAVVDYPAVIAAYDPERVTCNMPVARRAVYPDAIALVGWGAVFPRAIVRGPFDGYLSQFPADELFRREADRIFTGLSPLKLIDVPVTHLPHALNKDRMWQHPAHWEYLAAIRQRIYACRTGGLVHAFDEARGAADRLADSFESDLRRGPHGN